MFRPAYKSGDDVKLFLSIAVNLRGKAEGSGKKLERSAKDWKGGQTNTNPETAPARSREIPSVTARWADYYGPSGAVKRAR